jgi:hypothetical protein
MSIYTFVLNFKLLITLKLGVTLLNAIIHTIQIFLLTLKQSF